MWLSCKDWFAALSEAHEGLATPTDPNFIVGIETADESAEKGQHSCNTPWRNY